MLNLIVFLDFDGTMHPVKSDIDKIFQHAGLLATWLCQHPDVQLVVSSSWREHYSLAELRDLLFHDRPELQDRVVGATPILKFVDSLEGCERDAECRLWLYDNEEDHDYAPWVALDDQPELFTSLSTQRLVLCDPSEGLTKRALDEAWQLLERFSSEAPARRSRTERSWEPLLLSHGATFKRQPLPDERRFLEEAPSVDALTSSKGVNICDATPAADSTDEASALAATSRRATWQMLPEARRWVTILLDIDDVICIAQPAAARLLHGQLRSGREMDQLVLKNLFSPAAKEVLLQAQQQMGGLIRFVISSSWREHFNRAEIEQIFRRAGLDFVANNLHEGPSWRCYQSSFRSDRAIDIEYWLERFHHGEPFVVIDDMSSGGSLVFHRHFPDGQLFGRVILCRPDIGLTADHLKAITTALRSPVCTAHKP